MHAHAATLSRQAYEASLNNSPDAADLAAQAAEAYAAALQVRINHGH